MVPVGGVCVELPRYALHGRRVRRQSRARTQLQWVAVAVAAIVAGTCCAALSLLPRRSYYGSPGSGPSHLIDILPSDLNVLESNRIMGALGVQLLVFGGWNKSAGGDWTRDVAAPGTLQNRLERITPTWKSGGQLDYGYDAHSGIFGDGALLSTAAGTTIAQLANVLEKDIGLTVDDFDAPARAALTAMLSWQLPDFETVPETTSSDPVPLMLLIFSFGTTTNDDDDSCGDSIGNDCPLGPGPSNELLAATAARFVNKRKVEYGQKVHIVAQWEIAVALWQSHDLKATAVGTPGAYDSTADIFELMLCEWKRVVQQQEQQQEAVLLAHPDHLRRVMWTAQTRLKQHRGHLRHACTLPQGKKPPRLFAAMQPYDLEWTLGQTERRINMFDSEPATVHVEGREINATWYDDKLGFFQSGDSQIWTHQREVWLLYDQWAVAKGIVTGTIDADRFASF